jgi:hypothetical protein
MSSKPKRIVLVDPLGDILFSGESMIAKEAVQETDAERCPETKRSAESGTFRAVTPPAVTEVDNDISHSAEAATQKRGPRAA